MVFWVEASKEIGMGHLMESLAIADAFIANNQPVSFVIEPYHPAETLLSNLNIPFTVLKKKDITGVLAVLSSNAVKSVVVDHRSVALDHCRALKKSGIQVVVIDQWGQKKVCADLLINSTMIDDWLQYEFEGEKPQCCFGARYAILRKEFMQLHELEKQFDNTNKRILVTMGGVDRTGAALRVIEALKHLDPSISIEVILGRGFSHHAECSQLMSEIKDDHIQCLTAVTDLGRRMFNADIVINSGGNTMYEMACVGTPGLVLWEDPHEEKQGRAFANKQAAVLLGNGMATAETAIREAVLSLVENYSLRKSMSMAGRELVDGNGVGHICNSIIEAYN